MYSKSICQETTEAIYIPRPPSERSRRDAPNDGRQVFCFPFFNKLHKITPATAWPQTAAKVNWMRLFSVIPMVVSECKSLLRFVGKLILCPVDMGVQSSCSKKMPLVFTIFDEEYLHVSLSSCQVLVLYLDL